jgi:N-acyl-D-amino-acid deacylase
MKLGIFLIYFIIFPIVLLAVLNPSNESHYDILIKNGKIIDGSGNLYYYADIGIKGEKIVDIGKLAGAQADRVIDARGLVVCPGFIDVMGQSSFTLLIDGKAESKVFQGVTTELFGEGISVAPITPSLRKQLLLWYADLPFEVNWSTFAEYFSQLEQKGISLNTGSYVGAASIRMCVLGFDDRPPTEQEMEKMKQLTAQSMEEGVLAISSALVYPPGSFATTEQLIELCKVASRYGVIYITHMRSEAESLLQGIEEAMEIGREAHIPVEIFHFKAAGQKNWHLMDEAIKKINKARAQGQDITADIYPYTAGATSLSAIVPPWVSDGGPQKFLERLKDSATRKKIAHQIETDSQGWENFYLASGGWDKIVVSSVETEKNKQLEGKNILEVAKIRNQPPMEAFFDLLIEENAQVGAVLFMMSEDNIAAKMKQSWVAIATDADALSPEGILGEGKPHPRAYGTYPRVLGRYVREKGIITLEDAIRKMTSLPAQRMGIQDRGLLKEGMYADITIFNPDTIIDKATYVEPHQFPIGVDYVLVNGHIVVEKGKHSGALPGKIIYGPGKQ